MAEIRRILVAIEPALLQGRGPELAAALATAMSAEIEALLIEDAALLAAASLPFTREILAATGASRDLTLEGLGLGFEVMARRAQSRLEQLTRPSGLRFTLRAVRGDPVAELAAAATPRDLLVFGRSRDGSLRLDEMRRIARAVARPVLFIGAEQGRALGVALLQEGTAFGNDALLAAGTLARGLPGGLLILHGLAPGSADEAALIEAAAALPGGVRVTLAASSGAALPELLQGRMVLVAPEQSDRPDESRFRGTVTLRG